MIDLERSLTDLARSVHDDDVAERMTGQVRHMVTRIRRRRAARHSATGIVGVGAAAAVAVGGLHLADRSPAPVSAGPLEWPSCGEAGPDTAHASSQPLRLGGVAGPLAERGEGVPLRLTVTNVGSERVSFTTAGTTTFVVLKDGLVTGTGVAPQVGGGLLSPDTILSSPEEMVAVDPCGDEQVLRQGDYVLVANMTVDVPGAGTVDLVSPELPFTVVGPATAEQAERTAALEDLVAASTEVSAQYPFGVCGTRVPATADDLLTIHLELDSLSYAAGDLMPGTAAVVARDGLTVLGNSLITTAPLVLTRDGVVVGRGHIGPEDIALNTFSADESYPMPVLGNTLLCGLPGSVDTERKLPSGTYQAYATLEVALKEIQHPDGTAESRSDLVVVWSQPVDITIR